MTSRNLTPQLTIVALVAVVAIVILLNLAGTSLSPDGTIGGEAIKKPKIKPPINLPPATQLSTSNTPLQQVTIVTPTGTYFLAVDQASQQACNGTDYLSVVDVSSSMNDPVGNGAETKIERARKALDFFLSKVAGYAPPDQAGIVRFWSMAELVQALTSDIPLVRNKAAALTTLSGTNIGAGLRIGQQQLDTQNVQKEIMILWSDGEPTTCPDAGGMDCWQYARQQADQAKAKGTEIYALGLPPIKVKSKEEQLLKYIANDPDETHYYLIGTDFSNLEAILDKIHANYCKCGNGKVDPGELCDDNNTNSADECHQCVPTYCGDKIIQKPNGKHTGGPKNDGYEDCDDGNTNASDGCYGCMTTYCGDGIVQKPNGKKTGGPKNDGYEDCDNGPAGSATCTKNCTKIQTICGDSIVQKPNSLKIGGPKNDGYEECDAGPSGTASCTKNCMLIQCGNGRLDPNEECDDGNTNASDGCYNCKLTYCGDGIVQKPNGKKTGGPMNNGIEVCDDGNTNPTDLCGNNCVQTYCGDTIVQKPNGRKLGGPKNDGYEDCDAGVAGSTTCTKNCTTPPKCGNGIVEAGEECDDGNAVNTDACMNSCKKTYCGDGIIQKPNTQGKNETCDDGNNVPNDGCTNCTKDLTLSVNWAYYKSTCGTNNILIEWSTTMEQDTVGFNVLWSDNKNGQYITVSPFIYATGSGSNYQWTDTNTDASPITPKKGIYNWYKVQEISTTGQGDETTPFTTDHICQ
ncbi:MAG: DUF4215 domain-containing protein [Nanoarchaeota archaeon]